MQQFLIGELEKNMESNKVVKPKFTTDFPEAVAREGADEPTLREHEEGALRSFIDTTNVGNKRLWTPLVDEDWRAICQAIFQVVEGAEWETVYYKYEDLHKAVKCKKSVVNKKAQALWSLIAAKDKGIDFFPHERLKKTIHGI